MSDQPCSFDPTSPDQSENFSFDFANLLESGETIQASPPPLFTLTAYIGTDTAAQTHVSGSSINGTVVTTKLSGLLAGVTYILSVDITTSLGQTLGMSGLIVCNPYPGC